MALHSIWTGRGVGEKHRLAYKYISVSYTSLTHSIFWRGHIFWQILSHTAVILFSLYLLKRRKLDDSVKWKLKFLKIYRNVVNSTFSLFKYTMNGFKMKIQYKTSSHDIKTHSFWFLKICISELLKTFTSFTKDKMILPLS